MVPGNAFSKLLVFDCNLMELGIQLLIDSEPKEFLLCFSLLLDSTHLTAVFVNSLGQLAVFLNKNRKFLLSVLLQLGQYLLVLHPKIFHNG